MKGAETLSKYLPEHSLLLLEPMLRGLSLRIKITKSRASKFGDYKPLRGKTWKHQISLNHDLNKYAFLITLVHEVAHLMVHEKHGNRAQPHGKQWKDEYSRLLWPFVNARIFPSRLSAALHQHLDRPTASSCTDIEFFSVLRTYDDNPDKVVVDHLPEGSTFRWRDGRVFRREEKLRKRYRCIEMETRKMWYFHPMAEVERLDF